MGAMEGYKGKKRALILALLLCDLQDITAVSFYLFLAAPAVCGSSWVAQQQPQSLGHKEAPRVDT